MILNNFEKILWNALSGATITKAGVTAISGDTLTGSYTFYLGSSSGFSIVNYSGGNTATINTGSSGYPNFNRMSLTFGSGTTEVAADDYQMESPYDTTDHFEWQNQVQSSVADSLTKVITASIANISDENLTVSEIGVVASHGSSSTTNYNHTLIARSLITPVTIAPNETKTFQYTLDFTGIAG